MYIDFVSYILYGARYRLINNNNNNF